MKNLGIEISKDAVGRFNPAVAEFLIEIMEVLGQNHAADTRAARRGLKMVVMVGEKVLPFVLPKEHRAAARIAGSGVTFQRSLEEVFP